MNCSQILYLCRPETTNRCIWAWGLLLWIALKFCIFVVLKQPVSGTVGIVPSCELLSNFVSLSSWNNANGKANFRGFVVNCSQILYLCRPETTRVIQTKKKSMLWIALKFCIFVVLKQLPHFIAGNSMRCELLSNFVSLSSWNNKELPQIFSRGVVNCSQILYLCRPETTANLRSGRLQPLWIALKFCIFVVLKQLN